MLQSIEVRNFQSLHHVSLTLAPLTVIVGPSSSGKSAFGRAVRMLASNARGTSFITHGETVCTVTAVTDRGRVTLRKGKEDSYVVIPHPDQHDSGIEHPDLSLQQTFTKLAGSVPEEVSAFLGIPPKDAINFAGQFDRPYLLDDTGNEVARTLGDLTNVTMVLEAAREGRRLSLAQNSTLKTRRADLAADEARIDEYRPLKDQRAALERAETLIVTAGEHRARLERLDSLTQSLRDAATALKSIQDIPAVPDIQRVREAKRLAERLARLDTFAAGLRPLPVVPAAPPSAERARDLQIRLRRLADRQERHDAAVSAIAAAEEVIADAIKIREAWIIERDRLASEASDPAAFRLVHGWLAERGAFGPGAERLAEHSDTLSALEERAS